MGFLKKLFGGGARGEAGDAYGLYFYIRSRQTGEVLRLRLHRGNDLSPNDNYDGFFVHKVLVGEKSFDRIEAELSFDKNYKLTNADITGGEMVDRDAYETYLEEKGTR
ncbi:MAG TPA: hypothetical protein VHP83_13635 [Aggregatilineaceae bacterium]|nr:hypothetical protein [Aggregatilineaceae bacterium]